MKKRSFLAIFMVFVLCLSMMLVGCQKDDAKKNNEDNGDKEIVGGEPTTEPKPELTAALAMENTVKGLSNNDCSVAVLEDMSQKKVITISMEDLFTNVLNLDADNSAFYDELSLNVEGQTLTGKIYCDGKDLAMTSSELLGPGVAVGVNFSTFAEDLEASGLLDLLMSELGGEISMLEGILTQVMEKAEDMDAIEEEMLAALEEIAQGVEYSRSEGTANVYGAEVDAVIFTYAMDKDDFKKLIDLYLDVAEKSYQIEMDAMIAAGVISAEEAEASNPFNEAREAVDSAWGAAEMSGDMKLYANPENGCIMQTEMIYTGTVEGETLDAAMTLTLGEDPATSGKYMLAMDMSNNGNQLVDMELSLTSTTEGSVDTTAMTLTAEAEGEKLGTMALTGTYDNDTSAYVLTLAVDGDTQITAKGTMDSGDDQFTITLDTLASEGEEMPLGIAISVKNDPNCEIPAVPEYANVLTDLGLAEMLEAEMYADEDYSDYEEYDDEDYSEYEFENLDEVI